MKCGHRFNCSLFADPWSGKEGSSNELRSLRLFIVFSFDDSEKRVHFKFTRRLKV